MASSVTAICNNALQAKLGQASIASINETSTEAAACLQFYEHARDYTLQSATWSFASRLRALEQNDDNDLEEYWAYSYEAPADTLRIVRVLPASANPFDRRYHVAYKRIGDNIYTDEDDAWIFYVRQVTDATLFSPAFVEALAWKLAHFLVQPLRLENRLTQETEAGFLRALNWAIALSEAEDVLAQTAQETMAEWHRGR